MDAPPIRPGEVVFLCCHGRALPTAVRHLERAHGIDSTRFQLFPRHLDTKRSKAVRHRNILLHEIMKYIPWGRHERLVGEHGGDDPRALSAKAHLIDMLYGQFAAAQSLRGIETGRRSHGGKLYHLGARPVSRSTLAEANASRPVAVFSGLLSALMNQLQGGYRRKVSDSLPDLVREVQVRIETGKVLRLFTNDLDASAEDIADLYKRRLEIELFFRWIKQTLKIKRFLGTSENAVRIQVTVALIAFMLLRLAHEANKIVESPLAFTRLIRGNLMQRRTIRNLLQTAPPPKQPQQHPLLDLWPDLAGRAA